MKEIFEHFKNSTNSINNISLNILDDLVDILHSYDAAIDLHFYHGYEYFMDLIEQMKINYNQNHIFNITIFKHVMNIFIYSAQK